MKKLILTLFVLSIISGCNNENQNTKLTECLGNDVKKWTSCHGTINYSNGDLYVGKFYNGKYHGQGTYFMKGGDKYIGEFKNDLKDGHGTYIFADGENYVGEWKEGKRHGKGNWNYLDGRKFTGNYLNDKRVSGKEYSKDGIITKEGQWINGVFQNNSEKNSHNFLVGLCIVNTAEWSTFNCNPNLAMHSGEMTVLFEKFEESNVILDLIFSSKCDQILGASKCINKTFKAKSTYEILNDSSIIQTSHFGGCIISQKYSMENNILFRDYAGEATGSCSDEQIFSVKRIREIGKNRIYFSKI